MIRPLLRPISRAARTARAHARGFAAWASGPAAGPAIRVWYGLRVPAPQEVAHGGIIKLQHLRRTYPGTARRHNVLYLVSSRLPDAPETVVAWARRKGARVVLNQNGVAYPAWHGPGWDRANRPIAALLGLADHVFYQSAFCKLSADRFASPASHASEVLHNPVDTAHFVPAPVTRPLGSMTMLLAGSQDQRYRFEAAVQALAILRGRKIDVRLLITGRLGWSADASAARRDADAILDTLGMGEHVSLLGWYSQADAPAVFQQADLLLHTKYNDPCPTVVLEALACGLPVVYSKSGGVPELVGDDAGIGVAAPLDWERDVAPAPDALADAVIQVQDQRARMSAAARQRAVERFDVKRWLARHDDVFRRLVTNS